MHYYSEDELYKVIGSNIKFFREKTGITQAQLAEKVQISISYLSKLEAAGCSKSLSIFVLNQIANALDTDITEFFLKR